MSLNFRSTSVSLGIVLLAASASHAQQPNPMDIVAEKTPFDVPYGAPVSLDRADAALAASVAEARARNWKMVCAVADSGGSLVSFKRMDGAQLASVEIAIHKARASAKFRRETKAFEAGVQNGLNYLMTIDDLIANRGGIALVESGKIIVAIGCSGGTGSQDEVVAKAGVTAVK